MEVDIRNFLYTIMIEVSWPLVKLELLYLQLQAPILRLYMFQDVPRHFFPSTCRMAKCWKVPRRIGTLRGYAVSPKFLLGILKWSSNILIMVAKCDEYGLEIVLEILDIACYLNGLACRRWGQKIKLNKADSLAGSVELNQALLARPQRLNGFLWALGWFNSWILTVNEKPWEGNGGCGFVAKPCHLLSHDPPQPKKLLGWTKSARNPYVAVDLYYLVINLAACNTIVPCW